MRCPYCYSSDTQVKDSRPVEEEGTIRRRRFCNKCQSRFTTFERVQLRPLTVVKKDNAKEPLDREKLFTSMQIALRKRAIKDSQIELFVNAIVKNLESRGETEISTHQIGDAVLKKLSEIDAIGYVRFASVYKDFQTVDDFADFIRQHALEK